MKNPILAIKNYVGLRKLVDVEAVGSVKRAITPILVMRKSLDEFNGCGMHNEDLTQRVPRERRAELNQYYAQGTLLIPSGPIGLRLDGTATRLFQKHSGTIRDGEIVNQILNYGDFRLRLGESEIYFGLEEIYEGIGRIATVTPKGAIMPLKHNFMTEICSWYGDFFREAGGTTR